MQVKGDSGDGTPNIARAETDKLLRGNADAIIGAASSSVSLSVIDKITGAGVVEFSPANTSTGASTPTPTRACTSGPPRPTSSRAQVHGADRVR